MYLLMALALTVPTIKLTVWPAGARTWGGQPVYTGVRVVVHDPEGEIPCPEIHVDWGDGSKSGAQSIDAGCDPYSQPGGTYTYTPKLHAYREASPCGGFTVKACVVDVRGFCKAKLTVARSVLIQRPGECLSGAQVAGR